MSDATNEGFPAQPGEAPSEEAEEVTPEVEPEETEKPKKAKPHKADH